GGGGGLGRGRRLARVLRGGGAQRQDAGSERCGDENGPVCSHATGPPSCSVTCVDAMTGPHDTRGKGAVKRGMSQGAASAAESIVAYDVSTSANTGISRSAPTDSWGNDRGSVDRQVSTQEWTWRIAMVNFRLDLNEVVP